MAGVFVVEKSLIKSHKFDITYAYNIGFRSSSVNVSIPELTIKYVIEECYDNILTNVSLKLLGIPNVNGHMDVDICVKDEKIAIAYDGLYYHKDKLGRDMEISYLLSEAGYKVIRLREKGLQIFEDNNIFSIEESKFLDYITRAKKKYNEMNRDNKCVSN